jgi:hypothetical protein
MRRTIRAEMPGLLRSIEDRSNGVLPACAGGFLVRSAALLVADLLQLPPLRARLDGLDRGSGTGRHRPGGPHPRPQPLT